GPRGRVHRAPFNPHPVAGLHHGYPRNQLRQQLGLLHRPPEGWGLDRRRLFRQLPRSRRRSRVSVGQASWPVRGRHTSGSACPVNPSRYTEGEVRFPFRLAWNSTASYVGLLAASFGLALFVSYIFAPQINDDVYDGMFRAYRPAQPAHPESIVLAIDELTLMDCGGIRGVRRPIAQALRRLAPAKPKVVAVDVILADRGNPAEDAALAEAFHATPNLVLSTELIDGGRIWEDPRPEFATGARLGHVSTVMDKDGVTRSILIDQHNARVQRRALALEAFLLSRGVSTPRESLAFTRFRGGLVSAEIQVGEVTIPVLEDRREHRRLMRVRFFPPDLAVPRISMKRLLDDPSLAARFAGKVVFV